MNEAMQEESPQPVLFLDSSQCSDSSLLFSIREVTSANMADVPPALTDASPEAKVLLTACEGASASPRQP
jgi:hypothetical protein